HVVLFVVALCVFRRTGVQHDPVPDLRAGTRQRETGQAGEAEPLHFADNEFADVFVSGELLELLDEIKRTLCVFVAFKDHRNTASASESTVTRRSAYPER